MKETAEHRNLDTAIRRYLQRKGLAHAVVHQVRDPEPAPPVLSWVWMATFYAASTLGAIVAIWEFDAIGRIVKVLVK